MKRENLSENVRWVLYTSCSDQNVLNRIPLLTDEELLYCMQNEKRKTGIRNLSREAKKRNLPIASESDSSIALNNLDNKETKIVSESHDEPQQLHLF